jgi:hypothetical protein
MLTGRGFSLDLQPEISNAAAITAAKRGDVLRKLTW